MFLCSGGGAAQPASEGVLRGNERKQGVWRGLSVLYMRFWPSRARDHVCGSRQLRKFEAPNARPCRNGGLASHE